MKLLFLLAATVAAAPVSSKNSIHIFPVERSTGRRLTTVPEAESKDHSIYLTNVSSAMLQGDMVYTGYLYVNGGGPARVMFDTGSSDLFTDLKETENCGDTTTTLTYGSQTALVYTCPDNTVSFGYKSKYTETMTVGLLDKYSSVAEGSEGSELCGLAFEGLAKFTSPIVAAEWETFTFYLGPGTSNDNTLTFGGYDPCTCGTGGCKWETFNVVPYKVNPNSRTAGQYLWWGITVNGLTAGTNRVNVPTSSNYGIIDSGTTLLELSADTYADVMDGLGFNTVCTPQTKGSVTGGAGGESAYTSYTCPPDANTTLKDLVIELTDGSHTAIFTLKPNSYLYPQINYWTNSRTGALVKWEVSAFTPLIGAMASDAQVPFILGQTFMRAISPINFDHTNKQLNLNTNIGQVCTVVGGGGPVGPDCVSGSCSNTNISTIITIVVVVVFLIALGSVGIWMYMRSREDKGAAVPQQDPDAPSAPPATEKLQKEVTV